MDLAPIVLFTYTRLNHLRSVIDALKSNHLAAESELFIFSDSAAKEELSQKVHAVRDYIKSIKGFKSVTIHERDRNYGLADNIIDGVSRLVNEYGKVIVLEDDIITSPGFLQYMNSCLDIYEEDKQVMHISGYMYPVKSFNRGTAFLRILTCWGWGTWKDAWAKFSFDLQDQIKQLASSQMIREFNSGGNANFYVQLEANYLGKINTWAVRWYASWYFAGGISVCPTRSLTQNIGHDGSGTFSKGSSQYQTKLLDSIKVRKKKVKENLRFKKKVNRVLAPYHHTLFWKLKEKIRKIIAGYMYKLLPELRIIKENARGLENLLSLDRNNEFGKKVRIDPPSRIYNTEIGDFSYVSVNSRISETTIGKFCSIGPNFLCGWGIHPIYGLSTSPIFYSVLDDQDYAYTKESKIEERKRITIGNDVFIGMNVTILDGVCIYDGAVIAAGAVVTEDVPPYAVVGGVPAKIMKYRFTDTEIEKLLNIAWWDWEEKDLYKIERRFFDLRDFIDEESGK